MISRPRNSYIPGQALAIELHAIGRPVTMFGTANDVRAGTIVRVAEENGELLYDVHTTGGGLFTGQRLGDLNNPQPNTFTYAP